MVIDLQRVLLAKVRQLYVLHVGIPIGQYINVLVVSSKITVNAYAWVVWFQLYLRDVTQFPLDQ